MISTILIIDDNPNNLSVLENFLQGHGFTTMVATKGELGLQRAAYGHPDLILLDIVMPGIDGFEVCRRLKANEQTRDIPVIFLTALTNTDDTVKGFDAGGVDYITKPIEPKEVLARVTTHLQIRDLTHNLQKHVEKLRHANNELKDFAYSVSHDLKAPLRGISRLAQWLVADYADSFDEQGKEMIDLLVGRVQRMDSLIDGILQYSRVGRIINDHELIPLKTLVYNIVDSLAPPETTQVIIEAQLPEVTGDATRITQVFQNLLSNAISHMDKPDGTIRIGVQDNGNDWTFSVADNGPGIDPRYHERIFQIFQTLTPQDERESTGIGLALVKKIVELHGGRVWVESESGEGSTFLFTLPKSTKAG